MMPSAGKSLKHRARLRVARGAINEIAYELGFGDPSHFARFFRKQTGMTSQDFRAAQLATPSRNLNVTACPPDDTYRARVS
ncbi:helix-turn-helix domain-containing protein [Pseudorhodoplanes sp.]|uniref:helix-turn-helix domain-containing protein n=1 Tax=Pseudorhodoplanes sp. TaxID=1934341 RepID=UPI003D0F8458